MHDAESATTVLAMHTLPYLGSLRYHGGGVGWGAGAGGLYNLVGCVEEGLLPWWGGCVAVWRMGVGGWGGG